MKLVLGSLLMLAFVACSSAKKTETATTTSPEVTAPATTTAETTSTDEAPAKKTKKSAPMSETASSDGSGLPAINGTEKSSVTCTNKSDTRKISVLNVTEGGCGVVYNKMGEDKTVAMAKSDMNYCDSVSSKIKTNLEGAGFNCGGAASTGTSSDQ